jgi:hypothetical protein
MGGSDKLDHNGGSILDDTPPAEATKLIDELLSLQAKQVELDRKLRDAANRQRFSADTAHIERAKEDERSHLVLLDRLMTRMRAVEAKLLLRRRHYH